MVLLYGTSIQTLSSRLGQKESSFWLEETTSSQSSKQLNALAVNRQFAEQLKFNARHTGFLQKELTDWFSYDLAVVNSGQNHNSKGCETQRR